MPPRLLAGGIECAVIPLGSSSNLGIATYTLFHYMSSLFLIVLNGVISFCYNSFKISHKICLLKSCNLLSTESEKCIWSELQYHLYFSLCCLLDNNNKYAIYNIVICVNKLLLAVT